jgi:hypothetical protein
MSSFAEKAIIKYTWAPSKMNKLILSRTLRLDSSSQVQVTPLASKIYTYGQYFHPIRALVPVT